MKHSIGNYFQYTDKLSAGAQPTANQLLDLMTDGYEAVVNISPASSRNALADEAAIVERTGMYYAFFPVDCGNLQPLHYLTFAGIITGLKGKKVFVHCGGNIKSSNLLHMWDVLANGKDEQESLQTLYKIQRPEAKWFDYFKLMGMQGLR